MAGVAVTMLLGLALVYLATLFVNSDSACDNDN